MFHCPVVVPERPLRCLSGVAISFCKCVVVRCESSIFQSGFRKCSLFRRAAHCICVKKLAYPASLQYRPPYTSFLCPGARLEHRRTKFNIVCFHRLPICLLLCILLCRGKDMLHRLCGRSPAKPNCAPQSSLVGSPKAALRLARCFIVTPSRIFGRA